MTAAIVQTKLIPPPLKKTVLLRPTLSKKLKRCEQHPLTLVYAGAGYGKSTALSAFFQVEATACCWYSVGAEDRQLATFVLYLIHAVRKNYPHFADDWMNRVNEQACGCESQESARLLCSLFVNELLALSQEVYLVIDDYHHVAHHSIIDDWMQMFMQYAPHHVHVILSSRIHPSWDMLVTLKVKGNLLEIGEHDLAFSMEEIETLFADAYEFLLHEGDIQEIYRQTEGWITAVHAMWQQLSAARNTSADVHRFLMLEVWRHQNDEVRGFVEQTCVLETFAPALCDELLGLQPLHSQHMIERIERLGLFLQAYADTGYRYHPMFREFVRQQLQAKPQQYALAHQRAADYFEHKQKWLEMIGHLCALEQYEKVAHAIHQHGHKLLRLGQLEHLLAIVARLPKPLKDRYYMVWMYEGDVHRYRYSYDRAIFCYTKGEQLAMQAGYSSASNLALERKANIFLDTIEPGKAEQLLQQALVVMEADGVTEQGSVRLYSLICENLVNAGRLKEAEVWYRRCMALQADFQDHVLEARLHLRSGRLQEARQALERKLRCEGAAADGHLPKSHRETSVLLSFIEALAGNSESSKKWAERGIMQGVSGKAPYMEACGWMRMGNAALLLPRYELGLPLSCYRTAIEMMEGLQVSRGKAEPWMGLCLLYGREGATELAMEYGAQALLETEKAHDLWLSAWIRLGMGIAAVCGSRWEDAAERLALCESDFQACGDGYGITVAMLWQCLLAHHTKREYLRDRCASRFLKLMKEGGYEFLLHKRTLFGPRDLRQLVPILLEAHKKKLDISYTSVLLSDLGIEQLTYHPGYTLRIQTLGGFKVLLGEKEVTEKDWQRGKAKELFQLFVTRRKHMLPKEEVMALLWGDLDDKAAYRDFKVALNALNTALEPERQARAAPFFVERSGTLYGLSLASGFELDAAAFEDGIRRGLDAKDRQKAVDMLQKALSVYAGEYIPERRYEDWCAQERERLKVLFLRGAQRLAELHAAQGDFDKAICWCERIIEKDPCWEEAYRLGMKCHYSNNNRHQALKWYARCSKALESELGVEPMPVTNQLYAKMTQQKWSEAR
ncbi:hypothetical protein QJ48_06990 [Paenibacillus sp. A3]|uniref:BTAD domain-containing putative transcriptional regulator n=1 Tax=Paenibacillus sp. A3 TaxID=1337054 RepID=UPI0006D564CA|nr:BTAD domain-containing putative transcriptional regulator [Paenibacillus sp. A3]KPV60128.1 hypothetical protein QJ48_06990 [Paenibacillus sp. A3]